MQFQRYTDGTAMDSAGNNLIDPEIKASMSPTTCDPPQIQRYLADGCNTAYLGPQHIDPKFPGALATTPNGVAPMPSSGLHHRQESPSFTHPSSSTCSSTLSPTMESEYYPAHSPPTPPDTQSWSAFPSQYESWGTSYSQLYHQFTGLADDCVKPLDVNPFQDGLHGFFDDSSNMKPSMLMRALSMSSDESSIHEDAWDQPDTSQQLPRQMSPDTIGFDVKEEIQIPELHNHPLYPPIDTDEDEALAAAADDVEDLSTKVKIEAEDDEEYQPHRRPKRSHPPSVSSNSRSQKAAVGSKRAHNASSHAPAPAAKRMKTEPSHHSAAGTIGGLATVTATKALTKGAKRSFPCSECHDIVFKDENGLQKHIKTQHTRPFICVFHFAGCKSTFASKNEWKRHCASQHLLLNYWLCEQDQCAKVCNTPPSPTIAAATTTSPSSFSSSHSQSSSSPWSSGPAPAPTLPNGAIFNRKDLYTQHLRRMHIPPHVKKQVKQKKAVPDWEDSVRAYQERAHRTRCSLPHHMACPVRGCPAEFEGPTAWDERMEHVAKHLDKASSNGGLNGGNSCSNSEQQTPYANDFGSGDEDTTLIEWATRPDVAIIRRDPTREGGWELHNPLRPTGHPKKAGAGTTAPDEDEDAEGEEFEE